MAASIVSSPPAVGTSCRMQVHLRPWYDDLKRVEQVLRKRSTLGGPSSLGCHASVEAHVRDLQALALEDEAPFVLESDRQYGSHHERARCMLTPSTCSIDDEQPPCKSRRYCRPELRQSLFDGASGLGQQTRRRSSLSTLSTLSCDSPPPLDDADRPSSAWSPFHMED
jgi:hypothetical protein